MPWTTSPNNPDIRRESFPFTTTVAGGGTSTETVFIDLNVKTGNYITYKRGLFGNEVVLMQSNKDPKDGLYKVSLGKGSEIAPPGIESTQYQRLISTKLVDNADDARKKYYTANGPEVASNLGIPGFRNTANPNPATGSGGNPLLPGDAPDAPDRQETTPQFTQQESFDAIKGLNVRTSYANLSYPIRRSQKQDYIKFEMLEYAPRKFSGSTLSGFQAAVSGGSIDAFLGQQVFDTRDQFFKDAYKKDRKAIGTVSLPISSPISDTNSVSWSDDEMGAFAVLGAGIFKDLVSGSNTQTPQTPSPDSPGTGNAQTKTLAINKLTEAALGGATGANLLTRTTGAIINPNIELLFKGPSLRTFSFTFPLLARSKPESEQILQIIRFFKQGMSVKRSESALFLKSPHTFAIKYIYAREENKAIVESTHPWINRIKECALTNCSVNYTPAGNYATYANGAMTMYEITLNFSELEPIFDDDYASLDGNAPGKDTMVGY